MDPLAVITCAQVRSVLRHLKADQTPGATPLSQLAAVRQFLRRSGFRPSAEACRFGLGQWLVEVVEAEMVRLRRRAGVVVDGTRSGGAGVDDAVGGPRGARAGGAGTGVNGVAPDDRATIRDDFAAGHAELESWSAVYHVYLRPDLGVDLATLTAWVDDRHRRTLQRRLRRGVEALTARLRVLEHAALAPSRAARLGVRLPAPTASRLFGVGGLVDRLAAGLIEETGCRVIALAGVGGVGKTAVARAVAERCAESGAFDAIVWLDAAGGGEGNGMFGVGGWPARIRLAVAGADPAAADPEMESRVAERLADGRGYAGAFATGPSGPSPSLGHDRSAGRERGSILSPAASWRRADDALDDRTGPRACGMDGHAGSRLVIIDGLDDPAVAGAAIAAVEGMRIGEGSVQALVTGRVGWSACRGVRVVRLGLLSPGAAMALLRHAAAERGLDAVAEAGSAELEPLVAATAGHPLAIQLAVGALRAADPADVAMAFAAGQGVAGDLDRQLWAAAWHRAGPDARAVVRRVAAGRDDGLDGGALCAAVDAGLIEPAGADARPRRWRTPPFLNRFLACQEASR